MRVWLVILLFALSTASLADSHSSVSKKDRQAAAQEFKRALDLQKAGQLEEALLAAGHACQLFPGNPEYMTAREALRQQAVGRHLEQGNRMAEAGNLSGAQAQFREALSMDPQNTYAQQRLHDVLPVDDPDRRRTLQLLASVDQIDLAPTPGPASIHVRGDTRSVYTQVGKIFGVTFRFDEAVTSRQLRLDLDNVDFHTAMQLIGKMSKTFWAPVSREEAIVASDTPELRRQYERQSVRTLYVGYVTTAAELNDIANILRNIFEITVVAVSPTHNTITVKAPRATVEAAASLIDNLMDVRPEILLEVQEFEFDTDEATKYGLNLPSSFVLFNIYSEIRRVLGGDAQSIIDQLKKTGTINPSTIPVADLANLAGSPLLSPFIFFGKGLGLTGLVVLPIVANFSETSSAVKTTERATLRALDGESATFRVGSRFPILTGSFSSLSLSANGRPGVTSTPQFQYQDLGLTVKAKPHYLSGGEVRLDLEFEVVGLGAASLNNIPELTNRSYKGNITVTEGEPSVIMAAVTDQEARTTTGYPGIGQLPVLSAIISSNSRQRDHNQIVVVITPHLIRKPFHETGASTIWSLDR
jgi:general secretion pathway protein D